MQVFEDESLCAIDHERIRYLSPVFNTSSKLEFYINPNNAYADLAASRLKFCIDIPVEFVPDAYFTSKLFEHLDVQINHVSCTSKSTDLDYILTDYFTSKLNYTNSHIETIGSLQGIWSSNNLDAKQLIGDEDRVEIQKRQSFAESHLIDSKRYFRYYFITRINSGVLENHPLPKDLPIKLTFYRADAEKALLSTTLNAQKTESQSTYDLGRTIRIINPLLELVNTHSDELDKKYAQHRLPSLSLPFLDKQIRREILFDGIDNFQINVKSGKFYCVISISNRSESGASSLKFNHCWNFAYCSNF